MTVDRSYVARTTASRERLESVEVEGRRTTAFSFIGALLQLAGVSPIAE
jgi:hypothetical protein